MNGMTLKQMQRYQFADALETYRVALASGIGVVAASLRVHGAAFDRRCKTAVRRVFRAAVIQRQAE